MKRCLKGFLSQRFEAFPLLVLDPRLPQSPHALTHPLADAGKSAGLFGTEHHILPGHAITACCVPTLPPPRARWQVRGHGSALGGVTVLD